MVLLRCQRFIVYVVVCFTAAWIGLMAVGGPGRDAGAQAPSPMLDDDSIIRVALNRTLGPSSDLDHDAVTVVSKGGMAVKAGPGGPEFLVAPGDALTFRRAPGGISAELVAAAIGTRMALGVFTGPVRVSPRDPARPLGVTNLQRPKVSPYPLYRGSLEISPSPAPAKLRIINELRLGDYLRGVVPNEMPRSFSDEALRAQAIAARSYAIFNLQRAVPGMGGDVSASHSHGPGQDGQDVYLCDSPHCQVYYGIGSEDPRSDAAIADTRGVVATFGQEVIDAVYCSTAGGHTEASENVWLDNPAIPYLQAVPDEPGVPDLRTEEGVRRFLSGRIGRFDAISPNFRWQVTWPGQELEKTINDGIARFSRRSYVTLASRGESGPGPASSSGSGPGFDSGFGPGSGSGFGSGSGSEGSGPGPSKGIGRLVNLIPIRRGASGRIVALGVVGTNGTWVVNGELNIRTLLRPVSGGMLKSSLVVFDFERDASGGIVSVKATGAGYGHGAGMSQWGAEGMARQGYSFYDIIRHYYTGASLSTIPVRLSVTGDGHGDDHGDRDTGSSGARQECQGEVRQRFIAPRGVGRLVIWDADAQGVAVTFNRGSKVFYAFENPPVAGMSFDVSAYLQSGVNEVTFKTVGPAGSHLTLAITLDSGGESK
ncbi:MAG: SpoIID/LytB domain-containing protein [Firmicutes bacterium]|nr:SpoIID/LytB domain-containing protein [Bacillota bacterium]